MGKGNLLGEKGEGCMRENLKIIKFVGLDHLYLMIIENMKVIGKIIKWMEKENLNGPMEDSMKENIKWIKKKDMEFLNGMMEEYTKVIGKMENSMEKENFIILKNKNGKKENGKMEKELFGMIKNCFGYNKYP
jgi:hypothetical protein